MTGVDGRLIVKVADDGMDGAELGNGSGIQGLVDRVGALSGSLEVDSPAGGGTRVTAVIPLTANARPEEHELPSVPRVLSPADAEAIQRRNVRNLSFRLASLGIVTGVLVVVGPYLPWIVWPLLGLGLITSLDAWRVFAAPPLSESERAGAENRSNALRSLVKRRRTATTRARGRS